MKLNLDPCNFVGYFKIVFNPTPMVNDLFDILEPYIATVHCKDYYLENRFVVHISETVIGLGMMDVDTILRRLHAAKPDGYAVIEHLPLNLITLAKQNLTANVQALGLPLG